ncbi:MAG: hypothetical protein MUC69_06685, partial [Gemmatimonadales bacterium]|nr:hypothetical protein [Gemmatimonadales bacterium]
HAAARRRQHVVVSRRGAPWAAALLPALLASASALAAQGRESPVGRWRLQVDGIAPAPVSGELRLAADGAGCRGTLALSLEDRPPVPLASCQLQPLEFAAVVAEAPMRFAGAQRGRTLEGRVTREGEPPGRWSATWLPETIEYYASPPRFTLTQLVGGADRDGQRLPGPVVATARAGAWEAGLDSSYRAAATRARFAVLPADRLVRDGPARMLGLHDRTATLVATSRALARIRELLPPAEHADFDRVFAGRAGLRTDLHGVAMEFARRRSPDLDWARVVGALQLTLPPGTDPAQAAVRALLRLRSGADTVTVATVLASAPSVERELLTQLLDAYELAEGWHRAALSALLTLHWVPVEGASRSPADLVRAAWRSAAADSAEVPAIVSRAFGDPQAVPRYGVPAALVPRLVRPENATGRAWLERHGGSGLMAVVQRLDWPVLDAVSLAQGGERMRLTSVPRLARASLNGFLEPRDAIAVEPSYIPVLALGAVVHEWLHLLVETRRAARDARWADGVLVLPAVDPWLAEGVAEAWSERVLSPAHAAVPLVAVGEVEKRARLARSERDDPHVLGYLAVRAALAAVSPGQQGAALARLLELGGVTEMATDPAFAPGWRRHAGAPDVVLPFASRRFLVPETTFTVQDGVPDAVGATIRPVP